MVGGRGDWKERSARAGPKQLLTDLLIIARDLSVDLREGMEHVELQVFVRTEAAFRGKHRKACCILHICVNVN